MSTEALIPPQRELSARRLAQRAEHLRGELDRSHFVRPRQRNIALALAVLALGAVLLATPAFGLRDHLVHLFAAKEQQQRPPTLIRRYFSNMPAHLGDGIIPGQARVAFDASIPGYGTRVLWVAPMRNGGYCSTWVGCDPTRKVAFKDTLTITGPTSKNASPALGSRDVHVFFEGQTPIHAAARVAIRFESGTSATAPIIWVGKPINAGFFLYELPQQHWKAGERPVALVATDASGKELARSTTASRELRDAQSKGLAPASGVKRVTATAACYGKEEATQTFSDPAGDQGSSADITSIKVIEYCEGAVSIELTLSGPPELTTDGPLIALDLDQNPDTGSAFDGTEVEFVFRPDPEGALPELFRADGWDFRHAKRVPGCCSAGSSPHTLLLGFSRRALGLKPDAGFNIVASSVANDPDTAPDFRTFNYQPVQGAPAPSLGPDRRAPKVLAFDSTASRGGDAKLSYWVLDGRSRARQVIRIFRGPRVLKTIWTPLANVDPFGLSETTWHVPSDVHGALRYSVRSIDAAGNESRLASAGLVVR